MGCTCDEVEEYKVICPYHAAVSQLELPDLTFGEAGKDPNFPFSPTAAGTFMTKPAMIKAVQRVHGNLIGPKDKDSYLYSYWYSHWYSHW